MTVTIIISVN